MGIPKLVSEFGLSAFLFLTSREIRLGSLMTFDPNFDLLKMTNEKKKEYFLLLLFLKHFLTKQTGSIEAHGHYLRMVQRRSANCKKTLHCQEPTFIRLFLVLFLLNSDLWVENFKTHFGWEVLTDFAANL